MRRVLYENTLADISSLQVLPTGLLDTYFPANLFLTEDSTNSIKAHFES